MADIRISDEMVEAGARRHDHWAGEGTIGALNAKRNMREILAAALAALSSPDRGQEPAAWAKTDVNGRIVEVSESRSAFEAWVSQGFILKPLFAHPAQQEDRDAIAENELQEIADGAWGDNPMVRGLARDRLAALAHPAPQEPQEGAGLVKALAWNGCEAETPFGTYTVAETLEDDWEWTFHKYPYGWPDDLRHPTEEAAKAAAQADYERRILSALAASPRAEPQDEDAHVIAAIERELGEWECDGPDGPTTISGLIQAEREIYRASLAASPASPAPTKEG